MAYPEYHDRIKETTTTTGTGSYLLSGVVAGFLPFSDRYASGTGLEYLVYEGSTWEIGFGTFTPGSPATISRDTIIASSNSGSPVNWGTGTRTIVATVSGRSLNRLRIPIRSGRQSGKVYPWPGGDLTTKSLNPSGAYFSKVPIETRRTFTEIAVHVVSPMSSGKRLWLAACSVGNNGLPDTVLVDGMVTADVTGKRSITFSKTIDPQWLALVVGAEETCVIQAIACPSMTSVWGMDDFTVQQRSLYYYEFLWNSKPTQFPEANLYRETSPQPLINISF